MQLLRFKFKNLFSMGEGEIGLAGRGLTLVTGYSEDEGSSNGAGKSSLANKGILWSLFGETAGGLKADAALNRHGKRKCFGEIHFEGTDGQEYKLRRERPAKLTLQCLAFNDKIDSRAWTNISAHTAKETQKTVDTLLGFDFKTFVQTSCFGQGRNVHYPSLPPKEQKAVLEQILPMEEVDRWAAIADAEVKKLKPKLDAVMGEFRAAQGRTEALNEQLEQAHLDGEAFEQKRLEKKDQAEKELEKIDREFAPQMAQLEKTKQKIIGVDIKQLSEELGEIAAQFTTYSAELAPVNEQLSEANNSRSKWQIQHRMLQQQLTDLNTDIRCPVCLRDYDDTTKQAVADKVTQQESLIGECNINIQACDEADKFYSADRRRIEELMLELGVQRTGREALIQEVSSYENQVSSVENRRTAKEAAARACIATAADDENPFVATTARLGVEIEKAVEAADTLLGQHHQLGDELEHLIYWRDVYGKELKLKLFEDACPFLDTRTTYHLERLRNKQIHCEFSTVKRLASGAAKEEFTVNVWSETGGRGFEALSGGEQQMVSFAIGLALADLASAVAGSESGFLILDEPYTELDARNAEAVVEYLTSEVGNGRDTIFLISNDEALKGLIPSRIHVIKSHGVTNVSP